MERRKFITGLAALVASPALVRASSLMPVQGERYFFWEYRCPMFPNPDWYAEPRQQAAIDNCFGPNGRPYIGVWEFFGKNRNIYSDKTVAFRKFEAPPSVPDAVLVGCT